MFLCDSCLEPNVPILFIASNFGPKVRTRNGVCGVVYLEYGSRMANNIIFFVGSPIMVEKRRRSTFSPN